MFVINSSWWWAKAQCPTISPPPREWPTLASSTIRSSSLEVAKMLPPPFCVVLPSSWLYEKFVVAKFPVLTSLSLDSVQLISESCAQILSYVLPWCAEKKKKKKKGKREEKKTERVCSFSLSRAFHCASVNVFAWRGLFKDARRLIVGDFPKGRRIMYYPGVGTSMFVRQVHGKFGFWLNPSGFPRTLAEVRFMISQCVWRSKTCIF